MLAQTIGSPPRSLVQRDRDAKLETRDVRQMSDTEEHQGLEPDFAQLVIVGRRTAMHRYQQTDLEGLG